VGKTCEFFCAFIAKDLQQETNLNCDVHVICHWGERFLNMQCHGIGELDIQSDGGSIALVGHPNVGKSVLFQRLTGQRVAISNYPGTTVEVAKGVSKALSEAPLIDTPGVIAFPPHSEDEEVTARVLLEVKLLGNIINPWLTDWANRLIPF
jgi:GTP1/Obg family GTP-binding protein